MVRDILELSGSLGFLDEIYDQLQAAPATVDASWHDAFGDTNGHNGHGSNGSADAPVSAPASSNGHAPGTNERRSKTGTTRAMPLFTRPGSVTQSPIHQAQAPSGVWPLVNAYRSRGHFAASLDPLNLLETSRIVELEATTWGFTEKDMDQVIEATGVHGLARATVRELVAHLRRIYASSVGIEFMHISSPALVAIPLLVFTMWHQRLTLILTLMP